MRWPFAGLLLLVAGAVCASPVCGPAFLTVYNDELYFSGVDSRGRELWKYDGTTASLVADINPQGSSNPGELTVHDGLLYFRANDGIHGDELWVYDGQAPRLAADTLPGSEGGYPTSLTPYQGRLYFNLHDAPDPNLGFWCYDGQSVSHITAGNMYTGGYFREFNGDLWFKAASGNYNYWELWKYDGSTPAFVTHGSGWYSLRSLCSFNGALYLAAGGNDGHGVELWRYDGVSASLAADILPGPASSRPTLWKVYNDELLFTAWDGDSYELWSFDGAQPTKLTSLGSHPCNYAEANGIFYFNVEGDLWQYNGATATRAADINPGGESWIIYLTEYRGNLYFTARVGGKEELWAYDGQRAYPVVPCGGPGGVIPEPCTSLFFVLGMFGVIARKLRTSSRV